MVTGQFPGHGVRWVFSLAPSFLIASAAGTFELQRRLLDRSVTTATDTTPDAVMQKWLSISKAARPRDFRQRTVDNLVVGGV